MTTQQIVAEQIAKGEHTELLGDLARSESEKLMSLCIDVDDDDVSIPTGTCYLIAAILQRLAE